MGQIQNYFFPLFLIKFLSWNFASVSFAVVVLCSCHWFFLHPRQTFCRRVFPYRNYGGWKTLFLVFFRFFDYFLLLEPFFSVNTDICKCTGPTWVCSVFFLIFGPLIVLLFWKDLRYFVHSWFSIPRAEHCAACIVCSAAISLVHNKNLKASSK